MVIFIPGSCSRKRNHCLGAALQSVYECDGPYILMRKRIQETLFSLFSVFWVSILNIKELFVYNEYWRCSLGCILQSWSESVFEEAR